MRTTTIFAETHTSERANHVAYRLVTAIIYYIIIITYARRRCYHAVCWLVRSFVRSLLRSL